MRIGFIVLASVVVIVSPILASDFEDACIESAPGGVNDAGDAQYCACLAEKKRMETRIFVQSLKCPGP